MAYKKCVATLWHDRICLFVYESRAPVTSSCKPRMYALRTYFFVPDRFSRISLARKRKFKRLPIIKTLEKVIFQIINLIFPEFGQTFPF